VGAPRGPVWDQTAEVADKQLEEVPGIEVTEIKNENQSCSKT
jgi:hypothetical protein